MIEYTILHLQKKKKRYNTQMKDASYREGYNAKHTRKDSNL